MKPNWIKTANVYHWAVGSTSAIKSVEENKDLNSIWASELWTSWAAVVVMFLDNPRHRPSSPLNCDAQLALPELYV